MNKPQLFCYTYAGGNASFFDTIGKDLEGLELVKPDYAGHGERRKEKFYGSFTELAEDLFGRFRQEYAGGRYGIFGYSMGAIAAAEVLKRILAAGEIPPPAHVFLAAHEPHTKAELSGYSPEERDEWVKDRTVRFGGIPEKLRNNGSFWRIYLPLYRADYGIIGGYRFEELDLKTDVPLTVFYAESDTPLTVMTDWKRYFTGKCEFTAFAGNHFFIREHHAEMADRIRTALLKGASEAGDTGVKGKNRILYDI